jgi:cobalt/nickel transport protein
MARLVRQLLVIAGLSLAATVPAQAHFQMLYPGSSLRMANSGPLDLLAIFTHPFYGQPSMQMGAPQAFFVVKQRGDNKPEKVDLIKQLEKIDWLGSAKEPVAAYKASLPSAQMRSLGDYVFVLQPEPYLEKEEDKYIQQFTKTIVNVGGVPGNWDQVMGLPAEIRPLNKPYANYVGGLFRGVVLSKGRPVPFAEVEVEYINRKPDLASKAWIGEAQINAPHPALGPQSIRADATGAFAVALPKAGFWGIAALNVGPVKSYKGKKLSQDAVIWVEATDIK